MTEDQLLRIVTGEEVISLKCSLKIQILFYLQERMV